MKGNSRVTSAGSRGEGVTLGNWTEPILRGPLPNFLTPCLTPLRLPDANPQGSSLSRPPAACSVPVPASGGPL